jgi:hypothetical protein
MSKSKILSVIFAASLALPVAGAQADSQICSSDLSSIHQNAIAVRNDLAANQLSAAVQLLSAIDQSAGADVSFCSSSFASIQNNAEAALADLASENRIEAVSLISAIIEISNAAPPAASGVSADFQCAGLGGEMTVHLIDSRSGVVASYDAYDASCDSDSSFFTSRLGGVTVPLSSSKYISWCSGAGGGLVELLLNPAGKITVISNGDYVPNCMDKVTEINQKL